MRREEMHRKVPVLRIGRTYFVWKPNAPRKQALNAIKKLREPIFPVRPKVKFVHDASGALRRGQRKRPRQ